MGDPICSRCGKPLTVTTSRADAAAGLRVQYLGCRNCGIHTGQPPRVITLSDASRTKLTKTA